MSVKPIPSPTAAAGRRALGAILAGRSVIPALSVFHEELGDVFQLSLGSFNPVFMVGPDAARFMLVTARNKLLWRTEHDPVTTLLRNGFLVTDGDAHEFLRSAISPSLHRSRLEEYLPVMWRSTDRIALDWSTAGGAVDMLVEMRRVALLIVMDTLFNVDILPDLDRILPAILDVLRYISPGLWTVWPRAPRQGFERSLRMIDDYLHALIEKRRAGIDVGDDLLSRLIDVPEMDDDSIRDQMLTLLIAGHDTSTALLAWLLVVLGQNPSVYDDVQSEIATVLGNDAPSLESISCLRYMRQVVDETLRLYPPIHIGNRLAVEELDYDGYRIAAGTRVVYSIYLTHRHPQFWQDPQRFDPDRFAAHRRSEIAPYSFLPFGGGPRNCIGAAFAQIEARVVLARILQRFELEPAGAAIRPYMGATLEPHPGVPMYIRSRRR